MSDYSKSKQAGTSNYPVKAIDSASLKRIEPLLNPEQLISRFIFGIPLQSPITKQEYTLDQLQDYINRAINFVELDAQVDVYPVKRRHRIPFNSDLYQEFMYVEIPNKPILSVDKLGIVTSDNTTIYDFPKEWIDNGNFIDGRINVIPFAAGTAGQQNFTNTTTTGGGFLVLINQRIGHIPCYWEVHTTTGFSFDGGVPMIINELIGLKAAIMIFNNLIPQFQYSSYSLGLDGVSQSQSTQAPQLYAEIRDKYEAQYEDLVKRIKMIYNNTLLMSMV